MAPLWSPEGTRIVYASARDTPPNLFVKSVSEAARPEDRLFTSRLFHFPTSWSADGRFIIYGTFTAETGFDISAFDLKARTSVALVQTPFDETGGRVSTNGRWIAYTSDETGRREVYVRPVSGLGRTSRISTNGGDHPVWRDDGRELFYVEGGRKLMTVAFDSEAERSAGQPTLLFETRFGPTERSPFAVGAGGRRILANVVVGESEPSPITVVVNWPALAK